jgi:hypothetical protein
MRALARCAGGIAVAMIMVSLVSLSSSASATSVTDPLRVTNAASHVPGPVPRGAMLNVFVPGQFTLEPDQDFDPWERGQTPLGMFVEASCTGSSRMRLPMLSVRTRWEGSYITVYYPNSVGSEPFGACANSGISQIAVHQAFGEPMTVEIETVNGHPGIFTVGPLGDIPDGTHAGGASGTETRIIDCNQRLPAEPNACPVRTDGDPARLRLLLTGSEVFDCDPCPGSPLIFELAPVVGGVTGAYVPQTLASLVEDSLGVEKATVVLRGDTAPGEYWLRVRNTLQPDFSQRLRVEFGQPVGAP